MELTKEELIEIVKEGNQRAMRPFAILGGIGGIIFVIISIALKLTIGC